LVVTPPGQYSYPFADRGKEPIKFELVINLKMVKEPKNHECLVTGGDAVFGNFL
jgi:hypothetical protein